MKTIKQDYRHGLLKIGIERPDDLWYLASVLDPGDKLTARTLRKLKVGGGEDRSQTVVRKPMTLAICLEKTSLEGGSLRLSGKIIDGPEDLPRGSYHTLSVEPGDTLEIIKEHWHSFQTQRIAQACQAKQARILICLLDRDEAIIAVLSTKGAEVIAQLRGEVQKKGYAQQHSDFFAEVASALAENSSRRQPDRIILASPSFWKEELKKRLPPELASKILFATVSSVSEAGLHEVLRRPEVLTALHQERVADEVRLVEAFLQELARQGAVAYGYGDVERAVNQGAAKDLLVTDQLIAERREAGGYAQLEQLMRSAERLKATVHLISVEHEAGRRLQGIGGIAAMLRYRM